MSFRDYLPTSSCVPNVIETIYLLHMQALEMCLTFWDTTACLCSDGRKSLLMFRWKQNLAYVSMFMEAVAYVLMDTNFLMFFWILKVCLCC